jgi:GMP synthase-like glutamine amidotransferase
MTTGVEYGMSRERKRARGKVERKKRKQEVQKTTLERLDKRSDEKIYFSPRFLG